MGVKKRWSARGEAGERRRGGELTTGEGKRQAEK